MTSRFTVTEDEQLVELVRGHPILWNMAEKEFKNTKKKDRLWNEIGMMVNKSGSECKTRWRSIKDHRQRQKKNENSVGTGPAATKRRASYWNSLNFLDTVQEERPTSSNLNCSSVDGNEISDLYKVPIEHVQTFISDSAKRALEETTTSGLKQDKRFRKGKYIINLLKQKEQERIEYRKRVENTMHQEDDDEIDLFFRAMAATVKKFNEELKMETKMRVFSVVTEMETQNRKKRYMEEPLTFNYDDTSRPPSNSSSTSALSPDNNALQPILHSSMDHT